MNKVFQAAVFLISVTAVFPLLNGCQSNQDYYTSGNEKQNKAELAAVKLPDEFEITRINGKEFDTPIMRTESQHFFFPSGQNQIEFRYKKFWQTGADNHEVVRSLPFLIEATLESGHTYKLEYRAPTDLSSSREFAKKPQIRLLDEGGKTLAIKEIAQPSVQPASTEQTENAGEMLKAWWKKASPEQRREFDEWLKLNR